jgi:nucleotide-binding universal stress UspA family protein
MNKKMKILIAYDGSACADLALDDLHRAGLPQEAEALVVSVSEVWLPPPPPSSYEIVEGVFSEGTPDIEGRARQQFNLDLERARELADQASNRLRSKFPRWQVTAESFFGSPASQLITRADEWKPDLIVVGSHGRSALGRLVLGSVSQKVLAEAHTSVRVARGRVEVEPSPARIVIAVDGSTAAEAAVREVAARTWPLKSEARVIVVDEPLVPTLMGRIITPVTRWVEESNEADRQWVKKMADAAAKQLHAAELNVSVSIKEGNPKRVLVEEAENWGADCIFLGSTGFSNRFERFMLGSVSAAVAARAHCSVEIVRYEKTGE